ncbi:hypothetical protein ASPZODRAFT_16027 [Penicilliopsis zonata CBS 506.65]|uniref:Oleate hydratase n=1 Tax=Penicilliopsis zonata CBS 506.65 TaxID=1073090 RepID=A0A1L9SJL0_9EURO|nr:hypothetical protein ASPZODRAFT_16027 [Penicilliopsis zonata CBS 506.65]OJJ47347.1 hypothetical protein ASPZODRAFT_16027 [Penicilliopsis zonata CBS 506.65]
MSSRDPQQSQCWIIGGGVACLAAAVHLLETGIPGPNIHFIEIISSERDKQQRLSSFGNAVDGYSIHAGLQPDFHGQCMRDLLRLVPSDPAHPRESLYETLQTEWRQAETSSSQTPTRLLQHGQRSHLHHFDLKLQDRLDLARIMMVAEDSLADQSIRQLFDSRFFASTFWIFWSTTFALQPWHSAKELRRHLCKHLPDIQEINDSQIFGRLQMRFFDAVVRPLRRYLAARQVDFWPEAATHVSRLVMDNSHVVLTQLEISQAKETTTISLGPHDVCILNPGPIASTVALGSHFARPDVHQQTISRPDSRDWSLWYLLAAESPRFGNPANFIGRVGESRLVTFTVTLRSPLFLQHYVALTGNQPGAGGAMCTLGDSRWCLSVNVPRQPVFDDQPANVQVIWGYGLNAQEEGTLVHKGMAECTGEEILSELLVHLQVPSDAQQEILASSVCVPCVMPYATAAMLTRVKGDRPDTLVPGGNVALVGQFVELPDEPAFSMEYNVRGAQLAVSQLMQTPAPRKAMRNRLFDVFDILA